VTDLTVSFTWTLRILIQNMGHYSGYSEFQYGMLLERLACLHGRFILSSYPSEVLSKAIEKNGWGVSSIEKPIGVTKKTAKRKTEVLVMAT
jgi:DNA adenine methylase